MIERLRILLVEDDMLVRMSTADMLTDLGHEVLEAGNAQEALGLLETQEIDLLMTDLGLPGMTGDLLALEAQKRSPREFGIVFASGADRAGHVRGTPLENAVMLPKPFSERDIAAAIEKALPR